MPEQVDMTEVSPSGMLASPIIIQGAQVLLPSGQIALRDVAIADGKITAIGTELEVSTSTRTVDGQGLTMLPGVIDSQVRFHTGAGPIAPDDWFIESCACVRGGVTSCLEMTSAKLSCLEMPNTASLATTEAVLSEKLAIAAQQSLVNYGFLIDIEAIDVNGADTNSADASDTDAAHINLADLLSLYPICGLRLDIGSANEALSASDAAAFESVFAAGDSLITVHFGESADGSGTDDSDIKAGTEQESGQYINASAEQASKQVAVPSGAGLGIDIAPDTQQDSESAPLALQSVLDLSRQYKRRLHIQQVPTSDAITLLQKDRPSWTSAALTPEDLLLAEDISEPLWRSLRTERIDLIASGHTPYPLENSSTAFPSGYLPGVETSLPLMLTQAQKNRCSIAQVSDWMSAAVARVHNIPNKGLIEPGYDADLVLVDLATYRPVLSQELQTQAGWSPYEGWVLTGWPVITIVGGRVVYERGEIDVRGRGRALQFGSN